MNPSLDDTLHEVIACLSGRRFVFLTGAGCSTDSGIPDYRSPSSLQRKRPPIQGWDFLHRVEVRRRYWARSTVGWPFFSRARPNAAHEAIASMERSGHALGVITQNVDRLHHRAGSEQVLELHGCLHDVRCLQCGTREARDALQARLRELNPRFEHRDNVLAPDGDAVLDDEVVQSFRVPVCVVCEGMLKPDVVFFGENVPQDVVARAFAMVDACEAMVIAGTSLAVYSGLRYARRAAEQGKPIVIVNRGTTRGDELARVRWDAGVGESLTLLARALTR